MHDERSHPLLQQTPLSVNPYLDFPKAPTLPHNYASLPSTLPASSIAVAPAPSNPDLPAYVTSPSGFAAHPSTIVAQNKALLSEIARQRQEAEEKIKAWEDSIKESDLAEKRRKAPGYLDSNDKILEPERAGPPATGPPEATRPDRQHTEAKEVDDLGAAMDRAFGRSEIG